MLERVFWHSMMQHKRLGDTINEFSLSKEDLQECIHYRLSVAPNLEYFDSIEASWKRLKESN
jgi:hypothetical protein